MRERRGDLNVAGRYPAIVEAIPKLKQVRQKESLDSPAYHELAGSILPIHGEFRRFVRLFQCLPLRHRRNIAVPAQAELDIGSNLLTGPLKNSELAEVFDRVRTLVQIEVSDYQMYHRPDRTGGIHRQSGLQRSRSDHWVRGTGAGEPACVPGFQRLQRPGRNWRDNGRDAQW